MDSSQTAIGAGSDAAPTDRSDPASTDHSVAAQTEHSDAAETEITAAAIRGFGRLWHAVAADLRTHPTGDGGLICEDRRSPTRPTLWRVAPDGTIHPDTPYSFRLGEFVAAALQDGVSGDDASRPLASA
jgi:hypothetical protein